MNTILAIFKYIAYLGLPFMLIALYFIYEPIISGEMEEYLSYNVPTGILIVGFGMSILSLRDVNKIDKLGKWLMDRPHFFIPFIWITVGLGAASAIIGLVLLLFEPSANQIGIGLISFGLGYLSLIKSLIDQAKLLTDNY